MTAPPDAPVSPPVAARARRRPRLNPVLARELRERMRRRRAVIVLTAYLLVLAAVMSGVYKGAVTTTVCTPDGCTAQTNVLVAAGAGRPVFGWLLFFVLALVCFIVPGMTSGAIAGERERQTLVPLQVTLLSPGSIVVGKLLGAISFTLLLLVATVPLAATAYALGGVAFGEVVRGVLAVVAVAAALGCLSIASSAVFRRVQAATVASYGVVFILSIGTVVLFGLTSIATEGTSRSIAVLIGNPFVATAHVLGDPGQRGSDVASPFDPIRSLIASVEEPSAEDAPEPPGGPGTAPTSSRFWSAVPFWSVSLLLYGVLAAASLWLAARRIRAPADRVSV